MSKLSIFTMVLAGILVAAPSIAAHADTARTLSMIGHGEVEGAPDMAAITAGVISQAPAAAAALAANTTRMTAVFAALKKLGVPDKDIRTAHFSVTPQYAGDDRDTPRHLTGYEVANNVSVRLENIAQLGAALDALVNAGADRINGINFDIRDPAPLLEKARTDAIADARQRAQTYAAAAGVTLGPILSIGEEGAQPRYAAPAAPALFAARAVPVAAGAQSVVANVVVVWEIH